MQEMENGVVAESQQELAEPAQTEPTQEGPLPQEPTGESAGLAGQQGDPEEIPHHVWEISRKRAQAQADRRVQSRVDEAYARMFAGQQNPFTGEPIRSEADYLQYERMAKEGAALSQLEQAGLTPETLQELVSQNPIVQQAGALLSSLQEAQGRQALQEAVAGIHALDPQIRELGDLMRLPCFSRFNDLVQRGYSLPDAYRIANFDSLMEKGRGQGMTEAVRSMTANAQASPGPAGAQAPESVKSFERMDDEEFERVIQMAKNGDLTRR